MTHQFYTQTRLILYYISNIIDMMSTVQMMKGLICGIIS